MKHETLSLYYGARTLPGRNQLASRQPPRLWRSETRSLLLIGSAIRKIKKNPLTDTN
jgi:hypothetical protein